MPTSRYQDKVLETYARSLLEAAKAENHVFETAIAIFIWFHLITFLIIFLPFESVTD